MAEEMMTTELDNTEDYIQAINDLKANSVSRESYMKLKAENKKLISNLIEGKQEESFPKKEKADIGQLRKELFDRDTSKTNLDYVSKSLQLRDALLERGDKDPFLPWGKQIAPTKADEEAASRVAEALQECVDYADGDPAVFNSELQRILNDTPAIKRRR